MALRDHFTSDLSKRRQWQGFFTVWTTLLSAELNQHLPPHCYAQLNVHYNVEIKSDSLSQLPAPTKRAPFHLVKDIVEVQVWSERYDREVIGVIDFVCPSNTTHSQARTGFTSKCITRLHQGIGVISVDTVVGSEANLHNQLLGQVGIEDAQRPEPLYAAAYIPIIRGGEQSLTIWHETLSIGGVLPTLPLGLKNDLPLLVDFNKSYEEAIRVLKI